MNESRKANVIQVRKVICLASISAMLAGLLFSRFLLSSGLIVFAATCLVHPRINNQFKTFLSSPFLCAMSLLFVLPLVSGFWTEDTLKWSQMLRIKLPLLLLPICFAGLDYFTDKDWERVAASFLVLTVAGACWSVWQYLQNINSVQAAYLKAQTIQTPLGNDHVRFSLVVSIAIFTAISLLARTPNKLAKGVLCFAALALIIYLHVLAVRTGLICFYTGTIILTVWLIRKKNRIRYWWAFALILLFPVVSWWALPTFKNRISYLKYDLSTIKDGTFRKGSNDGNRLVSIRAGWQLQNQHPFNGVGFGDIKTETDKWYLANFFQMDEGDKILPSSEWIMYGAGMGWPGFVLFSIIMLVPFLIRHLKKNIYWWLLNIFMALSYLFDIGLEVQFGVFVHCFILLWWYKWLSVPKVQPVERVWSREAPFLNL